MSDIFGSDTDEEERERQRLVDQGSDDPDWDPFTAEGATAKKSKRKGRRQSSQKPLFSSDAESDGGYSTGYSTGTDEDSGGEMFGQDALDPLTLLEDMEREAGEAGDLGARQPYQVFRAQRKAVAQAQRQAAGADSTDASELGTTDDGEEEMLLAVGRGRGRGRGRPPLRAKPRGRGGASASRGRGGGGAFGADFDDIIDENDPLAAQLGLVKARGKGGRKGSRRSKGKRKSRKNVFTTLPDEAARQLGQANLMYATGQYKQAVDLLMHVIKVFPNSAEPYHTLGLLHEALGNSRKALDFYMIAAHLTAKDITLWKRLAALSTEIGFFRQAVYCLTKAIAHDVRDADARWDRAVLYAELGERSKAIQQFQMVGQMKPGDGEVPKMLARLYHRAGDPLKAIAELERHIERNPENFDMTDVNILAELYMQLGNFTETHALIMRARQAIKQLQQEETGEEAGGQEEVLPVDLAVKDGLCLAHLGRLEEADATLADLRGGEEVTAMYPDLTLDVGCALATMGQHARALDYLCRLLVVPEIGSDPALWARLLTCHRALGDMTPLLTLYQSRLEEMPMDDVSFLETAATLAELYIETGRVEEAIAFMPKLDESIQQLQQRAASHAAAAAATAESLEQQHRQVSSRQGQNTRAVAMAAGAATAAAEAAEDAARAAAVPAPTELLMRKNKLHLALDQQHQFIQAVLPLVQEALERLAADSAAVKNPRLPKELARAINRRRRMESKGMDGARFKPQLAEESTVFQGKPLRRDRRKSHTKEADELADAYFAGLADGDDACAGGTKGIAGRPRQRRAAALRALFTDEEGLLTFTELLRALTAEGRIQQAVDLSSRATELCGGQARWFSRARRDVLALINVDLRLMMGMPQAAMTQVRAVLGRWPASCRAWSRFARAAAALGPSGTRSWTHVVSSARRRSPESVPAMIMQGHVYAFQGKFQEALSDYFQAYRFWPEEPLLLLSIGVAFIRLGCSDKVADRNRAVLQGFAFLQAYSHHRGSELLHESLYNIGRAAHALGLAGIAHHYYQRALTLCPVVGQSQGQREAEGDEASRLLGSTEGPEQQQQQQQQQQDVEMAEAGQYSHILLPPHRADDTSTEAAAGATDAQQASQQPQQLEQEQQQGQQGQGTQGERHDGHAADTGGQSGGIWSRTKSRRIYAVLAGSGVSVAVGSGVDSSREGLGSLIDGPQAACLDLSQETAHNLSVLYRASGATELVRDLYRRYLTVR